MWFSSKLLAVWLTALAWTAARAEEQDMKSVSLRTHTLVQPYLDTDMQSRWFEFGGDTVIRTDSYIRLAGDRPSQSGWLWSRVPLTATNWEIEVEFKIHGKNSLHGDGFAMWISKHRGQGGDVFGSIDKFEGLGLFFDTYKNNRPGVVFPYVMAMMGDGKTSYDKNNDGKNTELAGCSARGIRHSGVPTKFRLTYFQDKQLKLELQYKNPDDWITCFDVASPPSVPQVSYMGFSAETGELSDNFDIISIKSNNLYQSGTRPPTPGSGRGGKKGKNLAPGESSSGGWGWFFFKIIFAVLVLGGGYVGYTAYRTSKRSHRF